MTAPGPRLDPEVCPGHGPPELASGAGETAAPIPAPDGRVGGQGRRGRESPGRRFPAACGPGEPADPGLRRVAGSPRLEVGGAREAGRRPRAPRPRSGRAGHAPRSPAPGGPREPFAVVPADRSRGGGPRAGAGRGREALDAPKRRIGPGTCDFCIWCKVLGNMGEA